MECSGVRGSRTRASFEKWLIKNPQRRSPEQFFSEDFLGFFLVWYPVVYIKAQWKHIPYRFLSVQNRRSPHTQTVNLVFTTLFALIFRFVRLGIICKLLTFFFKDLSLILCFHSVLSNILSEITMIMHIVSFWRLSKLTNTENLWGQKIFCWE